eukprot:COSAG05_NODE_1562_length_4554_cov_110.408305_6_plen_52_part_00
MHGAQTYVFWLFCVLQSGRVGSGLCRWLETLPRTEFTQALQDMQVNLGGSE